MKTYTVKQVADMLGTNPETVRRWIRSKKLQSTKTSNKEGNVISEDMLDAFMKKYPKYAKSILPTAIRATSFAAGAAGLSVAGASALAAGTGILSAALVATPATLVAILAERRKKKNTGDSVDAENVKSIVEQSIAAQKEKIRKKETIIQQFQTELEAENEVLRSLQETLSELNNEQAEANADSEEQTEGESQKEGK